MVLLRDLFMQTSDTNISLPKQPLLFVGSSIGEKYFMGYQTNMDAVQMRMTMVTDNIITSIRYVGAILAIFSGVKIVISSAKAGK